MTDTAEMIVMLGTVISMLTTISNTVSRYDRIMKRLERVQIATEDATEEEHEMLEAVRAWQEDCAREDYKKEMSYEDQVQAQAEMARYRSEMVSYNAQHGKTQPTKKTAP